MRFSFLAAASLCLALGACTDIQRMFPGNPDGNPDADGYVGSPDSTYDAAANKPTIVGTVTYDPNAPMPADTNSPSAEPPPLMTAPPPRRTP